MNTVSPYAPPWRPPKFFRTQEDVNALRREAVARRWERKRQQQEEER